MLRAFVFAEAAVLVAMSVGVLWVYGRSFVRGAQLLPLHVALIALSYLLLVSVSAFDFGVGDVLSLNDLVTEAAYAIGIISLAIIFTYEKNRAK